MVSIQNIKDVNICIIIVTKFYVVSKTTCVMVYEYSNMPRFSFLEIHLAQVHIFVLILESLIDLFSYHVKKVFNVGFIVIRNYSQLYQTFLI
jgi:hypothetical protein